MIVTVVFFPALTRGKPTHVERGDNAWFWRDGCVVYAEVVVLPHRSNASDMAEIGLRPIGTLSGRFDASEFSVLSVKVEGGGRGYYVEHYRPIDVALEAKGQIVLAVVEDRAHYSPEGGYVISGEAAFMRKTRQPLEVVDGFRDPQVEATLTAIQDVRMDETYRERISPSPSPWGEGGPFETGPDGLVHKIEADPYWATHAVVFAEIKRNDWGTRAAVIDLVPKMTLAGAFDTGRESEIRVEADREFFPKIGGDVGDTARICLRA